MQIALVCKVAFIRKFTVIIWIKGAKNLPYAYFLFALWRATPTHLQSQQIPYEYSHKHEPIPAPQRTNAADCSSTYLAEGTSISSSVHLLHPWCLETSGMMSHLKLPALWILLTSLNALRRCGEIYCLLLWPGYYHMNDYVFAGPDTGLAIKLLAYTYT